MSLEEGAELTTAETNAVLARNETGVLSLARDDDPYAIPISYGFDAENRRFHLRLASELESEKRKFLTAEPQARFVVLGSDNPTYWSVVAAGTLEPVDVEALTVEDVEQYGNAKRPLFEVWDVPRRALDVQLYRLDPDTLSGRRIVVDDADASSP